MHPNLGKFVVEKHGESAQPVYLATAYRDGSGEWKRLWAIHRKDAQVYKLRANADKAAARWGGVVKRIEES